MSHWTLFSNHGHVLVCLSRDPHVRLRDVAAEVGITERAVQKIVRDLQDGQMLSVTKSGRRNRYRINDKQTLRHALEQTCTVKDLLKVINKAQKRGANKVVASETDKIEATPKGQDKPRVLVSIDAGISATPDESAMAEKLADRPQTVGDGKAGRDKTNDADREKARQEHKSKKKAATVKKTDTQQGSLF